MNTFNFKNRNLGESFYKVSESTQILRLNYDLVDQLFVGESTYIRIIAFNVQFPLSPWTINVLIVHIN